MKKLSEMSIRTRIMMVIVIAITISTGGITALLINNQSKTMLSQMETDGINIAKAYVKIVSEEAERNGSLEQLQRMAEKIAQDEGMEYLVLMDKNCVGIVDSSLDDVGTKYDDDPNTIQAVVERKTVTGFWTDDDGEKILDIHIPVELNVDGRYIASVNVGLSLENYYAALKASTNRSIIFTLIFIILFSILPNIFINMYIIKPLNESVRVAKAIADGDLTITTTVKSHGEISSLIGSLLLAKDNLRHMIEQIQYSSESVAAASEQVNNSMFETSTSIEDVTKGMNHLAERFVTNADTLDMSAKTISRINMSSQELATMTSDVARYTYDVKNSANVGKDSVEEIVEIINGLALSSKDVQREIKELELSTTKISEIVNVINQISEQTNLLALNAAIEAARAGESGRGFAVVAEEVRKLAEQSKESLEGIVALTKDIRSKTEKVVNVVSSTEQSVQAGVGKADVTRSNISNIMQNVENVIDKISHISVNVREHATALQEVTKSVDHISFSIKEDSKTAQSVNTSIKEQVSTMEEISATAQELQSMAESLQSMTKQFKVG